MFKALSDETRLRVLNLLLERECCVCEVMQALNISQSRASRALKSLHDAGILKLEKEGQSFVDAACGNGPVDAAYQAIDRITGVSLQLEDYSVRSVTVGRDAIGEATVKVKRNGQEAVGKASSTDIVEASTKAYLNAINRLLVRESRVNQK